MSLVFNICRFIRKRNGELFLPFLNSEISTQRSQPIFRYERASDGPTYQIIYDYSSVKDLDTCNKVVLRTSSVATVRRQDMANTEHMPSSCVDYSGAYASMDENSSVYG
jgi:hypothetical protein